MEAPLFGRVGAVQFVKYNAATGDFVGVMTSETPDQDHEVFDYDGSKPYFEEWSKTCFERSAGKNFGNVREMHGLSAAGKLTRPLQFDDRAKKITVTGRIVDPVAKRKAEEGVYVGLSIGGRYVDRFPDPDQPSLTRYVADPTEVSLVDSPNNPDATLELVTATGSTKLLKMGGTAGAMNVTAAGGAPPDEVLLTAARLLITQMGGPVLAKGAPTKRVGGKDLPASSFAYVGDPDQPDTWKYALHDAAHVKNALARWGQEKVPQSARATVYARIKAAAKRFGVEVSADAEKLIKSLYDLGGVASCLQNLEYIRHSLANEAEYEQDESPLPGKMRDVMAALGTVLKELAIEETDELLAAAGVTADANGEG